jgi:hypothetical protein
MKKITVMQIYQAQPNHKEQETWSHPNRIQAARETNVRLRPQEKASEDQVQSK